MSAASSLQYAGFWPRACAFFIDAIVVFLLAFCLNIVLRPLSPAGALYLNLVWPQLAVILFWIYCQETPGKMVLALKIVNASDGGKPSPAQCLLRYAGYLLSPLVLGLNFFCIAWDKNKRGWHDKLAGTAVIHEHPIKSLFLEKS